MTPASAVVQFRDAIVEAGLAPPEHIEADGDLHRFASNGKPSDDAGYYVLHLDGVPAGHFGCWRAGIAQTWRADMGRKLSPVEAIAHQERVEKMQREREAEQARRQAEAREKAAAIWRAASPVAQDHPYLRRKRVAPVPTLRELLAREAAAVLGYAPRSREQELVGRLIVVPIKVGTALSTLEFIDENGLKTALAGGAKAGGYWSPQALPACDGGGMTLLIGEGVATVLSAQEATGHPAVAALSCGNLAPVARTMHDHYPNAKIVILADLGNGEEKAREAALATGGLLALPDFGDDRPEGATDFNDLAQHRGAEAVKRAVESAAAPDAREPVSSAPDAPGADPCPRVELLCAADVEPEAVRWLWHGWIAAGKMHILAGPPGTGKTTLAIALAATITSGGRWPDGARAAPADVVIWSGEDGIADTLAPRLAANGADCNRVRFVRTVEDEGGRRPFDPSSDTPALALALARLPSPPALLIVDPIVSAVAGDSHKNSETRRSLQPLVDLGERIGCAILGISHFSKGTSGRDPVERVTGSIAFGALARLVLAAVKTTAPDGTPGPRLFARAKSNIGPDGGGFHYSLDQVALREKPDVQASRVLWGDPVEGEAKVLLAAAEAEHDDESRSATVEATEWLREYLSCGAMPAVEATREARKLGLTDKSLRRAREQLGVKPRKTGLRGGWEWEIPAGAKMPQPAEDVEDAQPLKRGAFDAFGTGGASSEAGDNATGDPGEVL